MIIIIDHRLKRTTNMQIYNRNTNVKFTYACKIYLAQNILITQ